jgi:hypothetical protein
MSASALLYLVGMGLVFVGERMLESYGAIRIAVDLVGFSAVGAATFQRYRQMRRADDRGLYQGHRIALILTGVGVVALTLYGMSTGPAISTLELSERTAKRARGALGALWPAIWIVATLPLLVVDRVIQQSPVVAPPRRIQQALQHGLAAALGIALVFPVNYLASRHNVRWELAHVPTARPSPSTDAIVSSLDDPVHVYAFLPPNSELATDIDGYFEALAGPRLSYRRIDQTTHPSVARQLRVRENGEIAFTSKKVDEGTRGQKPEVASTAVETLEIGTTTDDAGETLETLDQHVQQKLIAASEGQRVAYLTTGHGEYGAGRDEPSGRRLQTFERILERAGFQVRRLGVADGLAEAVPDKADLVAVIGPSGTFMEAERRSISQYLEGGGSLLYAVEPDYSRGTRQTASGETPLLGGLEMLGVRLADGVLASEHSIVASSQNRADRLDLLTDNLVSHGTTATLLGAGQSLFTPTAGHLDIVGHQGVQTEVTVNSPKASWADRNANLVFDGASGETRGERPIVAVSTRGSQGDARPWRAVVSADASMYTDRALTNHANRQFLYDSAHWLVGTGGLGGSIDAPNNTPIRHTREGQALWFYATVVGIPLLLLAAGAFRVWRREPSA